MAALDFPASPTLNQQYVGTNGVVYTWDGAVWTLSGAAAGQPAGGDLQGSYPNPTIKPASLPWTPSGATLTPTDPTKLVAIPGSPGEALRVGTRTIKGHLVPHPLSDFIYLTANGVLNAGATGWVQDDITKPSWEVALSPANDVLVVQRQAPGPGATAQLLTLDSAGTLAVPGNPTVPGILTLGPRTAKLRVNVNPTGSEAAFIAYNSGLDDPSQSGWGIRMRPSSNGDDIGFLRYAPSTGATTQQFWIDVNGNLTIAGSVGQKASGTTWANPSDIRLKKNIEPYVRGLAAILALSPKTFQFNGLGGSQDGLPGIGLIANDVQPVMPEMVSATKTKLAPDDADPVDLLMLDTTALSLAMINAIKELSARLTAVEAR